MKGEEVDLDQSTDKSYFNKASTTLNQAEQERLIDLNLVKNAKRIADNET